MKRMSNLSLIGALVLGGALTAVPALQARSCGGVGDVVGSFGWAASRAVAFVPPGTTGATTTTTVTPPTTTIPTATVTGSSTGIGLLVAAAMNPSTFASVGRLYLDGNGGVFSSMVPGMAGSSRYSVRYLHSQCRLHRLQRTFDRCFHVG